MRLKRPKWPIILPHISHIFPVWGTFSVILILNMVFAFLPPFSEEQKLRRNVIKDPFSTLPHQSLANYYLKWNLEEAEKEFYLAEDYYQESRIESSPIATWNNLMSFQNRLREEIDVWQKIARKYPQYEYAQLKLATLYFRLGDYDEAKVILTDLLKQNASYPLAQSLYSKLN